MSVLHQQVAMASNQPEYDSIASIYVGLRKYNFMNALEYYTIYKRMLRPLLDDRGLLTGKRILDLGCGDGHHTRKLKALNCAYALGVDISSTMIERAREAEHHDLKKIEYLMADAKQLPLPEQPFDLVTAFYLLPHARTREELLDMARTIYAQLGENKQFIGVTGNYGIGRAAFNQRKYGVMAHTKGPVEEDPIPDGTELIITFYNDQDEPMCMVTDYYYSTVTYEEVFKEAGFKSFQWVPYQCDPNAPNKAFFDDYINNPGSIGVIATK